MADFSSSIKKIIPTTGETKVLLGWGLATAVLFALQYVVFAFVTGSGVSSRRLPVLRVVSLGAVAYAVLMVRDLIAYYAGVAVDEMFSLSPVVVFGVLLFMTGFLIYGLHDIQDIGSSVVSSSERSGGNLFSFFFESDGEGFEDEDPTPETKRRLAGAHRDQGIVQQPPSFLQPAEDMSVSQYGLGSDPFTVSRASGGGGGGGGGGGLPAATRDKHTNQQNLDPRGAVGGGSPVPPQMSQAQAPLYAAAPMGGGLSGGSSFAAF
jgi:hypothetical protein